MKLTSRSREAERTQLRDGLRRDRSAARKVRDAFPEVEQIRIDLQFDDGTGLPPAAQTHMLNPPAQAYFRFPCPHFDCDGAFSLDPAVLRLTAASQRAAADQLVCGGARMGRQGVDQRCGTRICYGICVDYRTS